MRCWLYTVFSQKRSHIKASSPVSTKLHQPLKCVDAALMSCRRVEGSWEGTRAEFKQTAKLHSVPSFECRELSNRPWRLFQRQELEAPWWTCHDKCAWGSPPRTGGAVLRGQEHFGQILCAVTAATSKTDEGVERKEGRRGGLFLVPQSHVARSCGSRSGQESFLKPLRQFAAFVSFWRATLCVLKHLSNW